MNLKEKLNGYADMPDQYAFDYKTQNKMVVLLEDALTVFEEHLKDMLRKQREICAKVAGNHLAGWRKSTVKNDILNAPEPGDK